MITRLQIRNFKSVRELDLQLGPINVLVGPNMSGKSNILDVLRFLHDVFFPQAGSEGVKYAIAQRGGANEIFWRGGDEKLITIILEATDHAQASTKYRYELQLIYGAGDFVTTHNESLKLIRAGTEHDLTEVRDGFLWLRNADKKEWGGIGTSGVTAVQHATPNWDGYPFYRMVKDWRFYHLVPPAMKNSGPVSEGRVLAEDGNNLSAWLMWLQSHSVEAFSRLNEVLCDLFPELEYVRVIPTSEGRVYLLAK